jgi:hypothetical protein
MALLFVPYFEGDDCVINQEDILPILSKNYKRNGLLNKHDLVIIPLCKNDPWKHRNPSSMFIKEGTYCLS